MTSSRIQLIYHDASFEATEKRRILTRRLSSGPAMAPHRNTLHDNFDVEYVVLYRFADTSELLNPTRQTQIDKTNFCSEDGGFERLSGPLTSIS